MKRNTRQEILNVAKAMFNQKGFNAVSTSDISQSLGLSKGNLTYYFKKKEHILEAILMEMPSAIPLEAPTNLLELNTFFQDMQQVVQENSFYFWHHAQLSQLSSKIHEMQVKMYQTNVDKLSRAFRTLQDNGLIRKEDFQGEYEYLIDTLLLTAIYWIPFCELRQVQQPNSMPDLHCREWNILSSLLTDKGKASLISIFSLPLPFSLPPG